MPDYETLYPGRFLKKEVLAAPKVIRIMEVIRAELENEKGKIEQKTTIKYKAADGDGEIVWCKTNAALLAVAIDERDYEKWKGHLVTIFHDPSVAFGGKKLGGIRVYGSPEMKAPKRVEIKRPRRSKPEVYNLVPTDNRGVARQASAPAEPAPAPAPVDMDAPPLDEMPMDESAA